ncbi:MAG: cytochrome c oxidase assembly protein [Betaproteobacteria bacterium HGW-Betaproteobacteria-22]|nr:MAG: cytochrome c oxidase assembly protein [Betaproteobacteria bacterium HGW-Betaproteobacteria-22]
MSSQEESSHNESLSADEIRSAANRRLGFKMAWIVLGSLLFAFSLVPLYNVLCTVTGLNGKTNDTATTLNDTKVDTTRWVTVQFTSSTMPGLGWNFQPKQASLKVRPGQVETALFEAKNITSQVVSGRAVPSVTPGVAASHLKKIECFCFQKQALNPGETKVMPLRFFVSPDIPDDIKEMTLSYAFFSVENAQ